MDFFFVLLMRFDVMSEGLPGGFKGGNNRRADRRLWPPVALIKVYRYLLGVSSCNAASLRRPM